MPVPLLVEAIFGFLAFVSALLGRRRFEAVAEAVVTRYRTVATPPERMGWPLFTGHRTPLGGD